MQLDSTTLNAIQSLFDRVNQTAERDSAGLIKSTRNNKTGYMYVMNGNYIQLGLCDDLIDYANAAAGTTPTGRPVGIRTAPYETAEEAAIAVSEMFDDVDVLTSFISNSEADAMWGDVSKKTVQSKKVNTPVVDDRVADKFFAEVREKFDIDMLVSRFGIDVVLAARKILTINEFELRFFDDTKR